MPASAVLGGHLIELNLPHLYELMLTRPREARQFLIDWLDARQTVNVLSGTSGLDARLAQVLIDYFRVTQDYPTIVQFALKRLIQTYQQDTALLGVSHWLARFLRQLDRAGRLQEILKEQNISPEIADLIFSASDHTPYIFSLAGLLPENPWQKSAFQDAGVRIYDDHLAFAPIRPLANDSYHLNLSYRGSRIQLKAKTDTLHFLLAEGAAQPLEVYGTDYLLEDEILLDYL